MLDRRLQVLIDEERWSRLEREAERRKVTVSAVVREAIDVRYPGYDTRRRRSLQAVLDAAPVEVPDPAGLREELDDIRGRRHE